LPGVAAYLLDYYPVENAHIIDNVSLKSRAFVLLSFFQSRIFFLARIELSERSVLINETKLLLNKGVSS